MLDTIQSDLGFKTLGTYEASGEDGLGEKDFRV